MPVALQPWACLNNWHVVKFTSEQFSQAMENLFTQQGVDAIKARVNALSTETQPLWGKMSVDQMLAHLNVAYEIEYTDKHPKPGAFARFMIKLFAKNAVVGPKPYPRNSRTAPMFIVSDARDFEVEKTRLFDHLDKTLSLGPAHFDGKENQGFGKLSLQEWNTLFAKHIEHHLSQFGV